MHSVIIEDNGKPSFNKRMYGMKGYHAVLVDEERKAYDLRATYDDLSPLTDSEGS